MRVSSISEGWHRSFTVTPQQLVLVFQAHDEPPRLLLGEEAMVLQGFPIAKVSDLVNTTTNHVMADIAGNMVALPVLLALMMSAVACVSWREGPNAPGAPEPKDLEDALAAFHALDASGSTGEVPAQKRVKL